MNIDCMDLNDNCKACRHIKRVHFKPGRVDDSGTLIVPVAGVCQDMTCKCDLFIESEACLKCGNIMKKSGPFARVKREGDPAYSGKSQFFYTCMHEGCSEFYKEIVEFE